MHKNTEFSVIFYENTSFECAPNVNIGDIIWLQEHGRGNTLIGPLLVMSFRDIGYGSNRKTIWECLDNERNETYSSERKYMYKPGVF